MPALIGRVGLCQSCDFPALLRQRDPEGLPETRWSKNRLGSKWTAHQPGLHTFRHTYRSLLDATGAPIGVQQKLMRHAQVSTTMDVCGNALMDSKREANSRVVSLLLRTPKEPEPLRQ
jgi:integrase